MPSNVDIITPKRGPGCVKLHSLTADTPAGCVTYHSLTVDLPLQRYFTRVSTCICIRLHHFSNRGESRTVHGCGVVLDLSFMRWFVSSVSGKKQTHTHTHARTHAHRHTHTHIQKHTHRHTHIYTHTHTHTHTRARARARTLYTH